MVRIPTYDVATAASGEREFDSAALGERVLYRTLKEVLVQYLANRRQGDAHTKVRSEISGHRKKPWKQKKTGRARHGDRRSPLWRGGATVFGPRNDRHWHYYLPRRQRLVALSGALLGKLQDGEVREFRGLSLETPSAKTARKLLTECAGAGSVLVLLREHDPVLWLSFRNFPRVSVRPAAEATAYDLLAHRWVLAQEGALDVLQARCTAGRAAQATAATSSEEEQA